MKRLLQVLFSGVLALGISELQAHTNKTTMSARSHGVNYALEQGGGFRELILHQDKNRVGGNFQGVGFFNMSTDKVELGKYFLAKNSNSVTAHIGTAAAGDKELDFGYVIHDSDLARQANEQLGASITFEPKQQSYGATFNYYQNLDQLLKGVFFSVNLPVVRVENDVKLSLGAGTGDAAQARVDVIKKYFRGDLEVAASGASPFVVAGANRGSQAKLTNALIKGQDTATGIADIDIRAGYNFFNKDSYQAGINVGVTIPTGNKTDGKNLFQAIYGNGGHFAFGGGVDAGILLWGEADHNVRCTLAANYRYLFEAKEKRTLGIKDVEWGQYALIAPITDTNINLVQFVPAANKLTQNVTITPGSQVDGIANLAYYNNGFVFDVGYNLYFREAETGKLKDKLAQTYGIVQPELHTNVATAFLSAAVVAVGETNSEKDITDDSIDVNAALTPSQVSNKVYWNIGYLFKNIETPISIACGGHYEFVSSNSAIGTWGANLRAGIAF